MRPIPLTALAALAALFIPTQSFAASFDCEKTDLAADEQAICDNRDLNDADVRMVTTFELVSGLMAMGSRGDVEEQQIKWLTARQACNADLECLRASYAKRQEELMSVYGKVERPL